MTHTNDPISRIKKAEEDSKRKIEEAIKNFEDKLQDYAQELAKKRTEFEANLKEQGMTKLETTKKEANELFKSKLSTAESKTRKLLEEAKSKQALAVEHIKENFLEHIKI